MQQKTAEGQGRRDDKEKSAGKQLSEIATVTIRIYLSEITHFSK